MKYFACCCLLLGILLPIELEAQSYTNYSANRNNNQVEEDCPPTMYERWGIGKQLFENGEYRTAIEYFREVIFMDPSYVDAYEFKGHALFWLRDYEGALLDFNEAIRFYEDKMLNEPKLGQEVPHDLLLITHTDYDDKLEQLYNNRGTAYYEIGSYAEAYLDFQKALTYNPRSQEGKHNLELAKQTLKARNIPIPGTQPKDRLIDRIFTSKVAYQDVKGSSTFEHLIVSKVELTRSSTLMYLQLFNPPTPDSASIFINGKPNSRQSFYLQGENVTYKLKKAYDASTNTEKNNFEIKPNEKYSFILEFDRIPEKVDLIHLIEGNVNPAKAFNIYDIQLQ